MNLTEKLYGEQASKTFGCFKTNLNLIKVKYKDYLESNEIDFENSYTITLDQNHISYKLTQELSIEIKNEIENSFQNCLIENSKK
jgi:hypothetical protein